MLRVLVCLLCLLTGAASPQDTLLERARAVIREHPEMWSGAVVARGERSVVVGGTRALAAELAARADQAAVAVREVWGRPVTAVILIPATDGQAATLAAPARVDGFAALAGLDRVIVEPGGFARLSPRGRQVVLAHELTHVATGAAAGGVPMWLSEGFADYVGYRDSGIPVRDAAAELIAGGRISDHLPGAADFRDRAPQAYEEAWLACRYVAERFGEARLAALYRAALDGDPTAALVGTVGMGVAEFTAAWRAYLADLGVGNRA
ncbi:hypothetical protein J5X84_05825 [Streptosporangiaceae bacterium NEAU-GS5]|nr:hypothetical protein [Streptosporangiaceae bacterium NEAU-GS5]